MLSLLYGTTLTSIHYYWKTIALAIWTFVGKVRSVLSFHGLDNKESPCNAGDLGSIPGLRRSAGKGNGYPQQYSGLESSMDCIVHGIAKSQTRLSDFHFHLLSFRTA